jgi:hypothetical protein
MSEVLFHGVRIFDGTDTATYGGEVLVRDQSIEAVTPRGAGAGPGNGSALSHSTDARSSMARAPR